MQRTKKNIDRIGRLPNGAKKGNCKCNIDKERLVHLLEFSFVLCFARCVLFVWNRNDESEKIF